MSQEPEIADVMDMMKRLDDMLFESGMDASDCLSILGAVAANIISQAPNDMIPRLRDSFAFGVSQTINERMADAEENARYH